MHVVVLGAGIIGITTAYQLLKDGHEVSIVERAGTVAEATSFSNAGLIAPGHAYAWASPSAPAMLLRSLWRGDQAIRFSPRLSLGQWRWARRFLAECTTARALANTRVKARLCRYSQHVLGDVVAETKVAYDRNGGGLVYFYRSPARFEAGLARCGVLREAGIRIDALTADEVIARDPGLAGARRLIAGALHAPSDESGDCRKFTQGLAAVCRAKGASLQFGRAVTRLEKDGDRLTGARTANGVVTGDAYVLALGVSSPFLAAPLGIDLPVYPVKGYAMTVPITDATKVARLGGVDEDNLLAYCPMGDRLRLTATAEIAGYSTAHRRRDFAVMTARARELFPQGADFARAEHWAGLRPMTPTAMPIVDRSPYANLFINTGHGHMGWTMANGSARLIADLIGGKAPAIDQEGLRHEP